MAVAITCWVFGKNCNNNIFPVILFKSCGIVPIRSYVNSTTFNLVSFKIQPRNMKLSIERRTG